jgi:PKHD-type hydroxylase
MSQEFVPIPGLLKAEELKAIDELIASAEFLDGRASATLAAKSVKHNLQIDPSTEHAAAIGSIIEGAIRTSPLFNIAALPRRIHPFVVSKYGSGNRYGWHVDNPQMSDPRTPGPPMRTDLAMTIFLNEPDEYEGGELVLQTGSAQPSFKPPKGDAVLYPCQYVHRVNKVTKGERHAAVTWIQSDVRDPEHRQILFNLNQLHAAMYNSAPTAPETTMLLQTHANLFRMWCDG